MTDEYLNGLLDRLPDPIRKALDGQSREFVEEIALTYLGAPEEAKPDMLAFFESDGPEKVRQVILKHEDGTPTAGDLESWK